MYYLQKLSLRYKNKKVQQTSVLHTDQLPKLEMNMFQLKLWSDENTNAYHNMYYTLTLIWKFFLYYLSKR